MAEDDIPEGNNDIFDPDTLDQTPQEKEIVPLFQIFEGSRIAVGKGTGPTWKKKIDAAVKAYDYITQMWDEAFRYYNNSQGKALSTPRGVFKRGDSTENILYSNINIMLPAIYGKDPQITCSTQDAADEAFTESMQKLLNVLFRKRNLLNAKWKIRRAAGLGLLTNFGVLKLDFTKKDDSREIAIQSMQKISDELAKAKDTATVERLYGELEALEMNMEVLRPNGPALTGVLPHNLLIDPYAENQDGTDAEWQAERIFFATHALTARFTKKAVEDDEISEGDRVLIYKPTHKAAFAEGKGSREDGLGLVLEAIDGGSNVTHHTEDERRAYQEMYYTECWLVWDKVMRRVYLFHRDDFAWPIWVWDDPLKLSRFFPYFIIGFGLSTGGTVSVGETAYYLDQQDEINDINRQVARIRRTIFDFFFYDSDSMEKNEVEKFVDAIRGDGQANTPHILGVKADGRKVNDLIDTLRLPSAEYKDFFNKDAILNSINRMTNTNDALRGAQFKTNTNEASVETYQDSMRLSTGTKTDAIEDVVSDLAHSLAELSVQNYTKEDVELLIGKANAEGWDQMSVEHFNAEFSIDIVAGSMEKPNSLFKKKEAVQVAQAVGQFAQAAPGAVLRIMLRVLSQAFTDIVIKKEDWEAIDQEVAANAQKGVSTEGEAATGQEGAGGDIEAVLKNLPSEVKAKAVQMLQQGTPQDEVVAFVKEQAGVQ